MPSKEKVYVSGHRNPDTDSICAAISYANLVNKIGRYEAIPVRLGPLNKESEFVLKTFDMESPQLLKSVKQTVQDLDYDKNSTLYKGITLKTAWNIMQMLNIEAAPIIDDESRLMGLLTKTNIINGYMGGWDSSLLAKSATTFGNIADTLEATVLTHNSEDLRKCAKGTIHIAAMRSESAKSVIKENDIVIVGGDREDTLPMLLENKVGLIILTGMHKMSDEWIAKFEEIGTVVMTTEFYSFDVSQRIIQSIPIEHVMEKGLITTFNLTDEVDYVRDVLNETRYRCYPLLDEKGEVAGSLSRSSVLKGTRRKVILVDHNERAQSIKGIEQAEIIGLVDHHRIANFETAMPLNCRVEPVGCTCTIITGLYDEAGIEITKEIAGLMLSAILSDTMLFKSPTCTPRDISVGKRLAKIAEVDYETYGMEMFKAGTSIAGKTVPELFNQDYKSFTYGGATVGVAQVNSLDVDGFMPLKAEMLEYMNNTVVTAKLDFALLLVTDIINSNSEIFVAGDEAKVEKAFDVKLTDHQGTLLGVVSRKKQVVPAISAIY